MHNLNLLLQMQYIMEKHNVFVIKLKVHKARTPIHLYFFFSQGTFQNHLSGVQKLF